MMMMFTRDSYGGCQAVQATTMFSVCVVSTSTTIKQSLPWMIILHCFDFNNKPCLERKRRSHLVNLPGYSRMCEYLRNVFDCYIIARNDVCFPDCPAYNNCFTLLKSFLCAGRSSVDADFLLHCVMIQCFPTSPTNLKIYMSCAEFVSARTAAGQIIDFHVYLNNLWEDNLNHTFATIKLSSDYVRGKMTNEFSNHYDEVSPSCHMPFPGKLTPTIHLQPHFQPTGSDRSLDEHVANMFAKLPRFLQNPRHHSLHCLLRVQRAPPGGISLVMRYQDSNWTEEKPIPKIGKLASAGMSHMMWSYVVIRKRKTVDDVIIRNRKFLDDVIFNRNRETIDDVRFNNNIHQ